MNGGCIWSSAFRRCLLTARSRLACVSLRRGGAFWRLAFAGSIRRRLRRVARGELNLSALCAMSPHLNSENAAELMALCSGRGRREVEALLAERFPRADVRDSVRRIEALSADRFGVHFTADSEFLELFERARALASHRLPAGDMARVLKLGLKAFIREAEKERFAVGRKQRARRKVEAGATEAHPPGGRGASVRPTAEARARRRHTRQAGAGQASGRTLSPGRRRHTRQAGVGRT